MNRIAGVIRLHLQDRWGWTLLPWTIILCSFTINLIISGTMGDELYTGGLASIYIYIFIIGILSLAQTFPLALGLSVRRKDYFIGTTITIAGLSILYAIILCGLSLIERDLTNGWGTGLHFFNLPYVSEGPVLEQIWFSFSLLTHLFFFGFAIACFQRRFGRTGMNILFIGTLLVGTVGGYLMTYYDKWKNLLDWLGELTASEMASVLLMIAIVYALISYLMLRRSSV